MNEYGSLMVPWLQNVSFDSCKPGCVQYSPRKGVLGCDGRVKAAWRFEATWWMAQLRCFDFGQEKRVGGAGKICLRARSTGRFKVCPRPEGTRQDQKTGATLDSLALSSKKGAENAQINPLRPRLSTLQVYQYFQVLILE